VLGGEDAGLPEDGIVDGPRAGKQAGVKEFDTLAIGGFCDLSWVAAVAGEEVEVLCEVEVNGPSVALHVVGGALVCLQIVTGEEKVFALGWLPVVPDGFAIEAPELVAGYLHEHGALVDEFVVGAIGVDHPDAIDLLLGAFVAVHDQGWLNGREEHVADPVG